MEISSSPFLYPEDISNFFSFFHEMDNNFPFPASDHTSSDGINITASKKRTRCEDQHTKDIGSSIMFFNEQHNPEQQHQEQQQQQQQPWPVDSLLDFNHTHKVTVTNDFNSEMKQAPRSNLEHSRIKRTRRSSPAEAAGGSGSASASTPPPPPHPQQRRLWVKDRSKDWWEWCNHPDFPEEEFKKAFRMSKATFDMICEELDSAVMKKNTMLRDAIPVRQRVAVCIWRLATGDPLRIVSKKFGLGISTCHKLVLEVCAAIRTVLMPKFLQWPDEEKMMGIKGKYESVSSIPNVGGSMYTTHIPIIAPKISVAAYFNKRHTERNQKTSYSITVQGVVDPKGVFTDVCIGWPGSMPDDQVLEKSALYQRASRGLLKDVWVVGTSGFPLMDWVLVPYTHQNLTWTQHAFNEKIGEIQGVAKDAFARLKGRWSCLQKRTEVKLQDLPVVLGACCVLHNICEMRNEVMDPEMKFDIFDDEMIPENNLRSVEAIQARDNIAHNLLHHGLAGTSFL